MAGVTPWSQAGVLLRLALLPRMGLIGLVRLYQLTVSPMLGPVCRFAPSCSTYGAQALRAHGVLRGTWLTGRRLSRCHPWSPGGWDPVPARAVPDGRPSPGHPPLERQGAPRP